MGLIKSVRGLSPLIGSETYIAETATLIGDIKVGAQCSLWFNVVLRGDVNSITVGDRTNIQDNTVVHATYLTHSTLIESDVTVGHSCLLHGCKIGKGSLIGMGSIIMDGVEIGEESLVGAGTLVTEGKKFPPRSLIVGRPAIVKRPLSDKEILSLKESIKNYLLYKSWYE